MNMVEVNLGHFIAITFAGVFQGKRQFCRAVGGNLFRRQRAIIELKTRVAQAVTESIPRFASKVAIGAIAHGVIIEIGQVGC